MPRDDRPRRALVTNATGFAGPGAIEGLREAGFEVAAHDTGFSDDETWAQFSQGRTDLHRVTATEPEDVIADVVTALGGLEAVVSNDHYPAPALGPDDDATAVFDANYRCLMLFPFKLFEAVLPRFAAQGGGNVVMITSNRDRLPLPGGAIPDAARAGANALVRSLAIRGAPSNVTVNAVAPNFLYSETDYPKAVFAETEGGRAYVARSVPAGRLGDPAEIGEVIAFLAGARTRFLTGAVIDFSGGWPVGEVRPST